MLARSAANRAIEVHFMAFDGVNPQPGCSKNHAAIFIDGIFTLDPNHARRLFFAVAEIDPRVGVFSQAFFDRFQFLEQFRPGGCGGHFSLKAKG